jgi:hypothetical protein
MISSIPVTCFSQSSGIDCKPNLAPKIKKKIFELPSQLRDLVAEELQERLEK